MSLNRFLDKIGMVHVAINCRNGERTVLGVFSSIDYALESVQSYLNRNNPHTTWVWHGEMYALENVDDEEHVVYVMPYQLDNDGWRRYEQT